MQAKHICIYVYVYALMIRADEISVGTAPTMQAMQCKIYRISSCLYVIFMLGTVNAIMNLK